MPGRMKKFSSTINRSVFFTINFSGRPVNSRRTLTSSTSIHLILQSDIFHNVPSTYLGSTIFSAFLSTSVIIVPIISTPFSNIFSSFFVYLQYAEFSQKKYSRSEKRQLMLPKMFRILCIYLFFLPEVLSRYL